MMIPYVLIEFDETRDVVAYLEIDDVWFYAFPGDMGFRVSRIRVSYERHIEGSWKPVYVRLDGRVHNVTLRWGDSLIPPWACEFVDNYCPGSQGMAAISSDRLRDKLVSG